MHWPDVDTSVLCLVTITLLARDQSIVLRNVLAEDSQAVATHVRTVELSLQNDLGSVLWAESIVGYNKLG